MAGKVKKLRLEISEFRHMYAGAKSRIHDKDSEKPQNMTYPYWEQHTFKGHVIPGGSESLPHSAWASQLEVHPVPQYVAPINSG